VFDNVVGGTPLKSLTVTGTSDFTLLASAVTTSGAQNYNGAVTVGPTGAALDLTSTGGSVTFGNTVNDATANTDALTVSGNAVFDNVVGGTPLKSLTVTGTSDFTLLASAVTTSGAQNYNGTVTAGPTGAALDLTSTGGIVTFGSTLDDAASNTDALTVSGNAVFGGVVGGAKELRSLHVTGTSSFALAASAVTTGTTQNYDGTVTVGPTSKALDLTGTTISFGSTLDDAASNTDALTVSGNAVFGGVVGGAKDLLSLHVTGTTSFASAASGVATSTTQSYDGSVTVGPTSKALDLTGTTVTFGSTVDDAASNTDALTVSGNAVFGGVVGGAKELLSLHVTGTTSFASAASGVATSTTQSYDGSVTVGPTSKALDLTGTTVTFGSTVDDAASNTDALTVSGNAVFDGVVGGAKELLLLHVTGTSSFASAASAVTTSTMQNYDGAVTVGPTSKALDLTGTTITFGGTLDDAASNTDALTVTGDALFDGVVGGLHALKSLSVTGTADIEGGAVTTTTRQSYAGAVTLSADTTLNATTVTFAGTLNSDTTARVLTIHGAATFDGAVGGANPLKSLSVTGTADIEGGAVTTTTTQDYGGAATLSADTTLNATSVTFASMLDSDATPRALMINAAVTFDGAVGGLFALNSLSVTGTSNLNGGLIRSAGAQSYGGAVQVTIDDTLATLNDNANVTFSSTVDALNLGGAALTIDTSGGRAFGNFGVVQFEGKVGGLHPLAALTITSGPFTLNSGINVTTTGNVLITVAEEQHDEAGGPKDNLELGGGSTLTSSGGNIELRAGDNLKIDAGSTLAATAGTVTLRADFNNNDTTPGATIDLDGAINSPTINVFSGAGNDTINLQQTLGGTTTNINANGGGDTVNISSTAGASGAGVVSGIAGTVNVAAAGANNTLNLDDGGDATSTSGTLTATSITGLGMAGTVNYSGLAQVYVNLGTNAALDFNVQSTLGTTPVNLKGQASGTVDVGDLGHRLDGIAGLLVVDKVKTLDLNDQGSTSGQVYNIDNMSIGRPLNAPHVLVEYLDMGAGTTVEVNGGNQLGSQLVDDTFNLFLPNTATKNADGSAGPGELPITTTLKLDGGTSPGGFHNKLNVVVPQTAAATGNVYHAHVGNFGSADPIQIQNIQSLYMYGSPVDSNDLANDTSAFGVLIGGLNADTLLGGTGEDVLFGGGDTSGTGESLAARSATSFVFAEFAPQYNADGTVSYKQLTGNGNSTVNAGGGTAVAVTPNTEINSASDVVQVNGRIDALTFLTARFAPVTSLPSIFQQALAGDPVLSGLTAPPAGPAPLPVAHLGPSPTLSQLQDYVAAAFQDVLGRAASAADVSYWAGQLAGGLSRQDFATALTHSDEYYADKIITPAYEMYLGRAADAAGLAYWTSQLRDHGLTDEELEAGFIASAEFYTNAGGTDSGWVNALYLKLLNRPADANGLSFWLAQLAGGESREQVALGFTTSLERETTRVTGDYQTFLGRSPDQAGINYWVSEFAQGLMTNEDVIAGFVASDEFFSKHS